MITKLLFTKISIMGMWFLALTCLHWLPLLIFVCRKMAMMQAEASLSTEGIGWIIPLAFSEQIPSFPNMMSSRDSFSTSSNPNCQFFSFSLLHSMNWQHGWRRKRNSKPGSIAPLPAIADSVLKGHAQGPLQALEWEGIKWKGRAREGSTMDNETWNPLT